MWASRLKAIHLLLITGAGEPVNGVDPGLPPPPSSSSLLPPPPPSSSPLLLPPPPPPSSVVRMIFSCLWPEGFTLTPEPLQVASAKRKKKKEKMQKVPLKLKSLTHQIQTPPDPSTSSTLHQHHPSQTVSVCCDWEQVGSLSAALSLQHRLTLTSGWSVEARFWQIKTGGKFPFSIINKTWWDKKSKLSDKCWLYISELTLFSF